MGASCAGFIDRGYYDNDGTGSAIEFLREAIEERAPGAPKVRILLIEIRNSPDEVPQNACCVAWKASSPQTDKPWNLVDQVVAPATAFYEAGHGSVTERNRDNLDLLVHAYADQLDLIDHIVIDDQENTSPDRCTSEEYKTDPLNWSLTPAQQCEVDQSAAQASNQQKFQEARNWFIAKAAATEPPTRKKTRKR